MNLSKIIPLLSDRRAGTLIGAVKVLEDGIAAGSVRNVDFNDAKDTINRAIEEGAAAFLTTGPHSNKHPQSDWWLAAYACEAFVHGASNVVAALKRAKAYQTSLIPYTTFLTQLLPLVALIQVAKPLIVKRQDQPKVVSPKQAAKLAKSMTCQCCGRAIFAETGVIAHHGYQRPGGGWQTASCAGARELPFEVNRDALGKLIVYLKSWKARAVKGLADAKAERISLTIIFSDYSQKRDAYGRRPTKEIEVTRATFDAVKAENANNFRSNGIYYDFDYVKENDICSRASAIKKISDEIAVQTQRYNGWKQTHEWNNDTWKKI